MERQQLHIANISCGHCVATIENELSELEGVGKIEGDPDNRSITVEWETPATLEIIKNTLDEINYPAS
jgi:copper chaperone CopZ